MVSLNLLYYEVLKKRLSDDPQDLWGFAAIPIKRTYPVESDYLKDHFPIFPLLPHAVGVSEMPSTHPLRSRGGEIICYLHHAQPIQDPRKLPATPLLYLFAFLALIPLINEFAKRLLQHINKQEISNLNKLVNLTQKHMHGRVAEMLLYLSDHIYESDEFHTRLSRQDLADLTAMTKESLIRILKEMKNDGLVDAGIHDIKILDKVNLRNISITG